MWSSAATVATEYLCSTFINNIKYGQFATIAMGLQLLIY